MGNGRFQETEIHFWPSFIDVFVSVLIIFILISFFRLTFNVESIEMLQIQSNQQAFEVSLRTEFSQEMGTKVDIKNNGNFQQLTFSSEILFNKASTEVSSQGEELLDRLAKVFRETINQANFKQIQIEGHTDSDPFRSGKMSNWELSSLRAIRVVEYFLENHGTVFQPKLFSGTGYSSYQPIASNTSRRNKAMNRRIEIRLVYFSELKK